MLAIACDRILIVALLSMVYLNYNHSCEKYRMLQCCSNDNHNSNNDSNARDEMEREGDWRRRRRRKGKRIVNIYVWIAI